MNTENVLPYCIQTLYPTGTLSYGAGITIAVVVPLMLYTAVLILVVCCIYCQK